jgi:hypothetical protein
VASRALLIANWEYDDPGKTYAPLNGPRQDLDVMQKALSHRRFGLFDEVQSCANLKWEQIGEAVFEFLDKAKRDDSLLIYFSGHGDRLQDGRLALCGINTRHAAFAATSFDTSALREWIESANRAPSTVVILDCCYAGAMKGAVADGDIVQAFGAGTVVLSSAGNQPTKDAASPDRPSPFTAALAEILLDPALPGDRNGYLTVDAVYERLLDHQPPLQPQPKRNLQSQGTFALAKRERPVGENRPPLKLFHRPERVDVIDLRFKPECVSVESEAAEDGEQDLTGFDSGRRSAVRRLSQLTDAILRVAEYEEDPWAQRAVRRAWNCVGHNLFEATVPPLVRERIRSVSGGSDLLKLRLAFDNDETAAHLEPYPWEYLCREQDRSDDQDAPEYRPLALAPGLVVERVIRSDGPSTLESTISGTATIGVVSSLHGALGAATERIAEGLTSLADLNTVFDLRGPTATWGDVWDAVDQGPDILVMFAPVRRTPQGVDLGFWAKADADWHPAKDLIDRLHWTAHTFRAILLITFAAAPGRDSFRATSQLAYQFANARLGPVVFVCHAPRYAKEVPDRGEDTFPLLFVDSFTRGERFDHAFYYAKSRVAGRSSQESQRAFGVPGCYVIEPPRAPEPEPQPDGEPAGQREAPQASWPTRRHSSLPRLSA